MGLYRDESGLVVEVDDRFADARGYTPLAPAEREDINAKRGEAARADERGITGGVNAALTGAASGVTMGLSDVALGETLTPLERERVQAEIGAHPYLRAGGEIAGAVGAAFAAPGSLAARTPTGYLSNVAAQGIEHSLAEGGLAGTAKAVGIMGAEGAMQNAGQYIGQSALADKEVTAEGLAGSLGTGFAFGGATGGAALGIAKGTVAARRLFSRVMEGREAVQAAESTWTIARQEALEGDRATLQTAQTKLDEIQKAKREALSGRNEARAAVQEERIRVSGMPERTGPAGETQVSQTSSAEAPMGPEPLIDVGPQTGGGGVTSKYQRPEPASFDPAAAQTFDEGLPSARDQVNDQAASIPEAKGEKTGAFKRPEGSTARINVRGEPEAAPTALEEQLAGTKAKLDEGAPLKDIQPPKTSKGNDSNSIEGWLKEKAAFDDELSGARKLEDIKGPEHLRAREQDTLSEIRYKHTAELLGTPMAKMERDLVDVVDEYNAARKDFENLAGEGEISNGVPTAVDAPAAPDLTRPGKRTPGGRQAAAILDDAHEEALLRAKEATDPRAAGDALHQAHELESMLEDISDGVPKSIGASPSDRLAEEMLRDIKKVWRYEEASSKLADAVGEQAHPTSTMRAKGFADAEKDSQRKVMDRAARAADDADMYGPTYATPKERVNYKREQHLDAQRNLDKISAQERDAQAAIGPAREKVREGERAQRAAMRDDAKAARAVAQTAGKFGAQDAGGFLEIADLPGLPKPSDLPVIGPLLGAWLKYRTLKRAMGRAMGRTVATADAKVAVRAAQTRDRIARAVDRSLNIMERSAARVVKAAPAAAGVLTTRIYDDGEPDAPKGAPLGAVAATRIRELSAYVNTPGAIERDVRMQLRDVIDPDVIAEAEKHRRVMMEYILAHAPKAPDPGLLNTVKWQPSPAESMSWSRRIEAANDPAGMYERLAETRDLISLEAAETLRDIYPRLFQEAQQRVLTRASQSTSIPYRQRIQLSMLYQLPLDPALDPDNLKITQSVYDRKPAAAPGQPIPAAPSIASPVNLSQASTPAMDRR